MFKGYKLKQSRILTILDKINFFKKKCCDKPDIIDRDRWILKDNTVIIGEFILEGHDIGGVYAHYQTYIYTIDCGKFIGIIDYGTEPFIHKKACLNCGTCFGRKEYEQMWIDLINKNYELLQREELADKLCEF